MLHCVDSSSVASQAWHAISATELTETVSATHVYDMQTSAATLKISVVMLDVSTPFPLLIKVHFQLPKSCHPITERNQSPEAFKHDMAAGCKSFMYLGCWHYAALSKIIKMG